MGPESRFLAELRRAIAREEPIAAHSDAHELPFLIRGDDRHLQLVLDVLCLGEQDGAMLCQLLLLGRDDGSAETTGQDLVQQDGQLTIYLSDGLFDPLQLAGEALCLFCGLAAARPGQLEYEYGPVRAQSPPKGLQHKCSGWAKWGWRTEHAGDKIKPS